MIQQINLYSPIFRKEQKRFSAVAMLQASGLLLAGVVIIYAFLFWQVNSLRAAVKQADAQSASAAKRMEDIAQRFSAGDEIGRLETEIAVREQIAGLLKQGSFANTRGYSDFFIALARQHVSGTWLTAFNIVGAGEKMTLQGRSTTPELVPQYIQKLSREKSLAGREFHTFQITRPDAKQKDSGASYIEFLIATGASAGR
ncbi:MAG TPA: PilN domain-containing protein [Acidiferrobacterales bacterium]|nr:PilN domain-containing protein [Acidiferrobacterales bacterium]